MIPVSTLLPAASLVTLRLAVSQSEAQNIYHLPLPSVSVLSILSPTDAAPVSFSDRELRDWVLALPSWWPSGADLPPSNQVWSLATGVPVSLRGWSPAWKLGFEPGWLPGYSAPSARATWQTSVWSSWPHVHDWGSLSMDAPRALGRTGSTYQYVVRPWSPSLAARLKHLEGRILGGRR